jgi:hypothetical protein
MMSWKAKAGIAAGVVALIAALCFVIWYQHQMLQKQAALETQIVEMKKLQDGVVRAQASYVSKDDLKKFAKDNGVDLGPIQDDLKKLNAEIQGINKVVVVTPGFTGTNLPSTGTTPRTDPGTTPAVVTCPDGSKKNCPDVDPFGYTKSAQVLKLDEPFGEHTNVPWGSVSFSAWRDKPWDLTVTPREYTMMTVLSTDESGRHFVHNKLAITVDGKPYTLPIASSQFVEQYPDSSFRFDPSLYLGVDAGVTFKPVAGEVTPNLQMFLFSYGRTKINPDWIFLGLGLGYETQSNNLGFIVSPVDYNLGKLLPLIDNLYLGPSLSFDASGNVGLLAGVRVGL